MPPGMSAKVAFEDRNRAQKAELYGLDPSLPPSRYTDARRNVAELNRIIKGLHKDPDAQLLFTKAKETGAIYELGFAWTSENKTHKFPERTLAIGPEGLAVYHRSETTRWGRPDSDWEKHKVIGSSRIAVALGIREAGRYGLTAENFLGSITKQAWDIRKSEK